MRLNNNVTQLTNKELAYYIKQECDDIGVPMRREELIKIAQHLKLLDRSIFPIIAGDCKITFIQYMQHVISLVKRGKM